MKSKCIYLTFAIIVTLSFMFGMRLVKTQTVHHDDEQMVLEFLSEFNRSASKHGNELAAAEWREETNITDQNTKVVVETVLRQGQFIKNMAAKATEFDSKTLSSITRRQLDNIKKVGTAAQTNPAKSARLQEVIAEMTSIYSTAKVCLNDEEEECLALEPDLTRLMASSSDFAVLEEAWRQWRDATGKKVKGLYTEYVELSNDAVQISGYNDYGEFWRSMYESDTFQEDVLGLFNQILPLYEQIHAFARRRLKDVYGGDHFPASGHIPAHLLGNMWAQEWDINSLVAPFPDKPTVDVTEELKKQGYTPQKLFETAEEFFTSLGLPSMTPDFWKYSMIVKPEGRDVVCHPSAHDFSNYTDFRIKMCTDVTQTDFITVHHEMGHIEYFMMYRDQPAPFRGGANPGFHEAIGDVIALSVRTPTHLHKIGLLPEPETDRESDLNALMATALGKIAFLPFGYLVDQWRWSVFNGRITPDKYNEEWWKLRCAHQGIYSTVERTSSDFDPGAKFHVIADVPYIRYFVSFIIQFQFHKALCDAAEHTGPLHLCDIYGSKEAGIRLRDILSLGSSKPWPEVMASITGQPKMDAQPLMDYFKPLIEFLREENGDDYGWNPECPSEGKTTEPVTVL